MSSSLEGRVGIIGGHLVPNSATPQKPQQSTTRTRPPITTHVLDVSQGRPATDMEVRLEMWKGRFPRPSFGEAHAEGWMLLGC